MSRPGGAPAAPEREAAPAPRGIAALYAVPAPLLVVAAAMSVQFGAALAATLFDDIGPAGASVLRVGIAAAILLAVWRPRIRGIAAADLRLAALFGLALGGMNFTFYEALDRIPLGIAVTVEFLGPLAVAVVGSRRRLDLLWAALALAGIVLLASPSGAGADAVGLALATVAGICWAAYIVLGVRLGRAFHDGSGLALGMAVAVLVPLGPGIAEAGIDLLAPAILAMGAAVALLSSVIPYTLETESLRRLPANVFGVLMSLEPAVAAAAGFIVLGQSLGAVELAAIACVVAASVGVTSTGPGRATPEI